MSNLQDVPLAEPGVLTVADSEETQMSKNNSLKRFFKLSKKPAVKEYASDVSLGDNKELRKTSTLSRIFSRKKLPSNDEPEQSGSIQEDRPSTTPKPVKSSMSMYWKRLFNLHKNQNQDGTSGQEQSAVNGPEEVHELKLVQNDLEGQTDLDEPDIEPKQETPPEMVSKPREPKERREPKEPKD
ncbi:hypothetical protein KR054_001988, partial [Drosophila jambulina]